MEYCKKHPLTCVNAYGTIHDVVRVIGQKMENTVRKAKLDKPKRKGEIVLTENEVKLIQLVRNHPRPEKAIIAAIEVILHYLKPH